MDGWLVGRRKENLPLFLDAGTVILVGVSEPLSGRSTDEMPKAEAWLSMIFSGISHGLSLHFASLHCFHPNTVGTSDIEAQG